MYFHKRGKPQPAMVTLATEKQDVIPCHILFGNKESLQIQLWDPLTKKFDSWIMTYPARAIVSILQPPSSMSEEEFIGQMMSSAKEKKPIIERGN